MVKKVWLRFLLPGVLILIVGVGLLVKFGMERAAAEEVLSQFPDRGVPRMNISLKGVTLDEIKAGSKDTKYEGNELMVYEGDSATLEASGVRVKGRGNTTWIQPKKPYQLKFSKRMNLFEISNSKKWVLLANFFDTSLVRNDVAMLLAEMLGMEYNVRGDFVELYFDNRYEGLYYLLPSIELAKGSVNLSESGGVLFELDTLHREEEECYESYYGECLVLRDTVLRDQNMAKVAAGSFMKDFNEFEIELEEGNYDRIAELVDLESFAKYYLLSEFTVNPDAYISSFYLYKNGDNDKIHAGPAWDYDFALGNRNWDWQVDEIFYSPYEEMVRKREVFSPEGLNEESPISRLFYYLDELPDFHSMVMDIFHEKLLGRNEKLISNILDRKKLITDAAEMDEQKWGEEKWGDKNFEEEIEYLIGWVKSRYEFFEDRYGYAKEKDAL